MNDVTTPFVRGALRVFGGIASARLPEHPDLPGRLARARNPLVPVAYLSAVYAKSLFAAAAGLAMLLGYVAVAGASDPRTLTGVAAAPFAFAMLVYGFEMVRPDLEINRRRRDLDANLPYALNFMAALASAGVVPSEIFGALGKQDVYGEVRHQAQAIHRDIRLFSKDLLTAIGDAARRSPSRQWEEFLQGAVNTVSSGGDLRSFMLSKAEQFALENRRQQRGFIESLGVMAESYVVVAAAAPLFLLVILSVLSLLRATGDPVLFLNLLVLVALPIIHVAFIVIMRNMRAA